MTYVTHVTRGDTKMCKVQNTPCSNKVHHRSKVPSQQPMATIETSKLIVTTHFTTSPLRHDWQRIFIQQPNFDQIY